MSISSTFPDVCSILTTIVCSCHFRENWPRVAYLNETSFFLTHKSGVFIGGLVKMRVLMVIDVQRTAEEPFIWLRDVVFFSGHYFIHTVPAKRYAPLELFCSRVKRKQINEKKVLSSMARPCVPGSFATAYQQKIIRLTTRVRERLWPLLVSVLSCKYPLSTLYFSKPQRCDN